MNDKLLAGFVTAAAIAPICALCILGPAVLGVVLAGTFGWIMEFSPVVTTGLMMIAGIFMYGLFQRRRKTSKSHDGLPSDPATAGLEQEGLHKP